MAKNPMQKKSRNSFLLGVAITLLIMGIVAFLLFRMYRDANTKLTAQLSRIKKVPVLSKDIESGRIITEADYDLVEMIASSIPEGVDAFPGEARLDMKKGTLVTANMLNKVVWVQSKEEPNNPKAGEWVLEDEANNADVRYQEYNTIILPKETEDGDIVDIRLRLPTGEDFIVLTKKTIELPQLAGMISPVTIRLKVSEFERTLMDSAIIENYMIEGSMLYATKYIEAGMQTDEALGGKALAATYIPSASVLDAIQKDPNRVMDAATAKWSEFYNSNASENAGITKGEEYRVKIQSYINTIEYEERLDRIKDGVSDEIQQYLQERQTYIDALTK